MTLGFWLGDAVAIENRSHGGRCFSLQGHSFGFSAKHYLSHPTMLTVYGMYEQLMGQLKRTSALGNKGHLDMEVRRWILLSVPVIRAGYSGGEKPVACAGFRATPTTWHARALFPQQATLFACHGVGQ